LKKRNFQQQNTWIDSQKKQKIWKEEKQT
jgi:hypothetical protein